MWPNCSKFGQLEVPLPTSVPIYHDAVDGENVFVSLLLITSSLPGITGCSSVTISISCLSSSIQNPKFRIQDQIKAPGVLPAAITSSLPDIHIWEIEKRPTYRLLCTCIDMCVFIDISICKYLCLARHEFKPEQGSFELHLLRVCTLSSTPICLPQAASTSSTAWFQATHTRVPEAAALTWTYASSLSVCEWVFFPCGERCHLCTKCVRTAALLLTQAHTSTFIQGHCVTLQVIRWLSFHVFTW